MNDTGATLSGACDPWPSKTELLKAIQDCGLRIGSGDFAIRVSGLGSIVFRSLTGDISPPTIDGDAETAFELCKDAEAVSFALAAAGIRHRLEIYDANMSRAGYFHHGWPAAV